MKLFRPAPGRRVLQPNGEPLPDSGAALALTPYWRRLLADQDIEPVPPVRKPKSSINKSGSKSA